MGKYSSASNRRQVGQIDQTHAIWNGIGCLMILIVPVMAFAAAFLTVQIAIDNNWPLPYQLMGYPVVSPTLWKVGALAPLWAFIENQQNLYLTLTFMAVFVAILGTIIALLYTIAYRFVGPPRYGPLDEPPPNIKVKRYKR